MSETRVTPRAAPTGGVAVAQQSNTAAELASSLGGLNRNLAQFGAAFTSQFQEAAEARARNDAQTAEGRAFKKAVEDGVIERTQNPFYIREFERQSAAVATRSRLNDIRTQALEWEERDDPQAFEARWREAVGEATQDLTSFDQQLGIQPVIAEVSNQVLNANVSDNVQRIEQAREANQGALLAQTIAEVNQRTAGNTSAAELYAAIEDQRQQYIAVGGSQEEWDGLVLEAVTTTAYGQADSDILNVLKTPTAEGQTAIFNRPGIADRIENDRFRVQNQARRQAQEAEQRDYSELKTRAREAEESIQTNLGRRFLLGRVGPEEVFNNLRNEGFTNPEIALAMQGLQRQISSSRSWSRAVSGSGSDLDTKSFDLWMRASEEGLSDDLLEEARQLAEQGEEADARRIVETARLTEALSSTQAQALKVIDSQTDLNNRIKDIGVVFEDDIIGLQEQIENSPAFVGRELPFPDTTEIDRRMRAAAARVMTSDNPSFQAAFAAAQDAKADAINAYIDELEQLAAQPQQQTRSNNRGGNPRR